MKGEVTAVGGDPANESRMRASLQAPFVAPDGERRLLVVADACCSELDSYWLEQGLLARERALTPVPVTQVIVPSGGGSDAPAEAGVAR